MLIKAAFLYNCTVLQYGVGLFTHRIEFSQSFFQKHFCVAHLTCAEKLYLTNIVKFFNLIVPFSHGIMQKHYQKLLLLKGAFCEFLKV